MTRVTAVLVVRLKADRDLSLKWCQRTGNMKPARPTLASPNSRRGSVSAWEPSAALFRHFVVNLKTNIQPINVSGPAVLELC